MLTIRIRKKRFILGSDQFVLILTAILLCMSVWEGVLGALQLFGIKESNNIFFNITGSFYNPGPFGCFIAMTFPLFIYISYRSGNRWILLIARLVVLLDVLVISASLSRTAWLACIMGSVVAFNDKVKPFLKRIDAVILIIFISMVCLLGAFVLKEDSAKGRILMWKVAVLAINSNPFEGVGWKNVGGAYGDAQEDYFSTECRSEEERQIADAPRYVFNEYLQIAIAFGWGWMLIMIFIFVMAITSSIKARRFEICGCMAAVMVVMFASYPFQFQISVITMAMICVIALLSNDYWINKYIVIPTVIVGSIVIIFMKSTDSIEWSFYNGQVLHRTQKYNESNDVLKLLIEESSDPMILNLIGKNYNYIGKLDSAEYYLIRSTKRCPNRLYPHYLLMKLYEDTLYFNKDRLVREAEFIIMHKEKIHSPAIDDMKKEAYNILYQIGVKNSIINLSK